MRCCQVEGNTCMHYSNRPSCFDKAGIRRRVLTSSCYPAFFRGHQRVETPKYLSMMQLHKIWAEGSFSLLKREHCFSKIQKRGILAAMQECLLAVVVLNLKRMVNSILFYLKIYYSADTTVDFGRILLLSTDPTLDTTLRIRSISANSESGYPQIFQRKPIIRTRLLSETGSDDWDLSCISKKVYRVSQMPK